MSEIWFTALSNNFNQLMQLSHNHPLNNLYDPLLVFINTYCWLKSGNWKKSPTINNETLPNGNEFCMIAFNFRSKCTKVSLLSTDICFSTYEVIHHLAFYTYRISITRVTSEMKCRMQCTFLIMLSVTTYADDTTLHTRCDQASVATIRIGFRYWIWSMRHCGLGQEVACCFLVSFDQSNNTGAIDVKIDGSVL